MMKGEVYFMSWNDTAGIDDDGRGGVSERVRVNPPEKRLEQEDLADQDSGLLPPAAAVDASDQEEFCSPEEIERKKDSIASVNGEDVDEENLGKAA